MLPGQIAGYGSLRPNGWVHPSAALKASPMIMVGLIEPM
jgi:hypothetical protein